MTPEEFNKKIQDGIRSLKSANLVYPVATKVHGDMTRRIFDEGIMGNGAKIGNYSRKAMYASKKQFKNTGAFRPQGKKEYIKGTKQKTVKAVSIKTRKAVNVAVTKGNSQRESMYLPNGYKELKQIQGYEASFVNLVYSSDLRNDFATKLAVEGESVVLRLSQAINKKKTDGLTKKYGSTLFKHTEEEREFFKKELTKKVIAFIRP